MPAKKNPPGLWLFKEEPDHYNYSDLEKDGETVWDGITNNLARQNLWKVRSGDRVLFYHTGKEKAIVGEARVVGDPFVPEGSDDPKGVAVKVHPVRRWPIPLALADIKKDVALANWDLVRLSRLSVVPLTREQWQRVEQLAAKQGSG